MPLVQSNYKQDGDGN